LRPPFVRSLLTRPYAWGIAVLGLVGVSVVLLLWAKTRPGYDPYGWLVWGDQTLHWTLNLGGAPSWKPLPYLFTVPYALAGHYELWLWMITAVVVSLAGSIFAGRIAYRVTRAASPEPASDPLARYAPMVAAIFAGAAVLAIEDYAHYILSFQSDPMIVTFCLAAIDMCLSGRYRWSFVFAVLGSLGRPEVWPFLGLYSIWAWLKVPSMRWMVCAGLAVIGFMWFGIPWITNGRADIAGQLAMNSPRELHSNKVTGTIDRFTEMHYLPIWIVTLLTVVAAALRRDRIVLVLAGAVVLWVVIEIAFALHGFPALPRYMFEAGGVVATLAGIGVGWALTGLPRLWRGLPRWSGVLVVAVVVASLVPGAVDRLRAERVDLRHERGRTHEIALLATTINRLGGYQHIRACGKPVTIVEYASILAWLTHLDVGSVGYLPRSEMRKRHSTVLFASVTQGGWTVRPFHTRRSRLKQCSNLHAAYLLARSHPSGELIHT
jgi:hypothetical protein